MLQPSLFHDKRIVIVAGGHVDHHVLADIKESDFLIGADRGALTLIEHGYKPDIALGDFDSVHAEELERITRSSLEFEACDPIDKDYTDTELAFRAAVNRKPKSILLLGATGTRLDHTLANIHLLKRALELDIPMQIKDAHNRIQLTESRLSIIDEGYPYVSLLPLSSQVLGIDLEGFAYPLHNASLTIGQSLGISNKLMGDQGTISVREGTLLIIASRD
ncbi:thiamine diphosphokinase [Paenibacillus marinisediminis]